LNLINYKPIRINLKKDIYLKKIEKYRQEGRLRVLDLFSGCGGLSLGFKKAGFDIVAALEMDKDAIATHANNFHKDSIKFKVHCSDRDIQKTEPSQIFKSLGFNGNVNEHIDVIIGGPPCQAFTRIGRAKLRDITNDSSAFLNDIRSQLYKRYLDYVEELKPLAVLIENVPDILNYGGMNIAETICEDLNKIGYKCKYTLLNAVYYGVPQMRERMFLIGLHESIEANIEFPPPTHYTELPKGYHGSRNVALKNILNNDEQKYYVSAPPVFEKLTPAITVDDALSDLPEMKTHLQGKMKRGIKKVNEMTSYKISTPANQYQQLMRSWGDFHTNGKVTGTVIRYLPRDYPIFLKMKPGDQYPEALQIAKKIFDKKIDAENMKIGEALSLRSNKYKQILKETIPPYDDKKFPNKWRKMEADKPSRTLMAHLGKDSYSHIHYDSNQARTISVREAARLQSFPDGFQFSGSMNAAFRQIGNAVPPLIAEKLALSIMKLLRNE